MQELSPGRYTASWQVKDTLRVHELNLIAELITPTGWLLSTENTNPLRIEPRNIPDPADLPLKIKLNYDQNYGPLITGITVPNARLQAVWSTTGGLRYPHKFTTTSDEKGRFDFAPGFPPSGYSSLLITVCHNHTHTARLLNVKRKRLR